MRLSPSRQLKILLTAALFCFPNVVQAQDYTTGLVGYWTLDETSGTTATDSAGSNNGTMYQDLDASSDSVPGRIGTALNFAGTNQTRIDIPANPTIDNLGTRTACMWFNVDNLTNADSDPYIDLATKGFSLRILNVATTPVIRFRVNTTNVYPFVTGSTVISTGQWYHVCGVYHGVGITPELYINGVSENASSTNGTGTDLDDSSEPLRIGAQQLNTYYANLPGTIDDIRLYNRALSAADIAALYAYVDEAYTCANPDGVTGVIYFNDDEKVLQYCNGSNWASIGPQSSLTSGLAAHWTLDETSGASIADNAGTNTGTWTDGVNNDVAEETTAGQINTALSFDGTDDLISIPEFPQTEGTSELTIAAWIKVNSVSNETSMKNIISKDRSGFLQWNFLRDTGTGNNGQSEIIFQTNTSSGSVSAGSTNEWPTDTGWHHVVAVYNGTDMRIYGDGTLINTPAPQTGTINASYNHDICIGSEYTGSFCSGSWSGDLDDVRIYNRSLSATEVQELYNQTVPTCSAPSSNLSAHWTLDETSGASIADNTGTNTGTWTDGANNDVAEETVAGQVSTAISFDETDDIVTVPHHASLDISTAYTVSGWVYFDSAAAASPKRPSLISKNDTGGWGSGWVIGRTSGGGDIIGGNIRLAVQHNRSISSPNADYSGWVYPVDTWNYVTITWDGNTVNYYLNAALVDTGTITIPPDTGAGDLLIGYGRSNWYTRYHAGRIDDLRIYDRALPLLQIQELYGASGGSCTVSNCASPFGLKSEIVFNSDYNVMQYCNGNKWIAMGPPSDGGGGCSNPAGLAGELRYNADSNLVQYCEGDEWIAASSSVLPSAPTSGLIAHWALDETSGSAITDSSGNSNNGTWSDSADNNVSGETTTGVVSTALTFDGTDDLIDVPTFDVSGTGLTLAGWYYANSFPNDPRIISKASGTSSGDHDWALFVDDATNQIRFRLRTSGSTVEEFDPAFTATTGVWHHVAVTYDSATDAVEYYISGVNVGSDTHNQGGAVVTGSGRNIALGNQPSGAGSRPFDGELDDVRVYDRPLSAAEILSLYNLGSLPAPPAATLVGHWTLDETSGTTAADSSGNGYDGTMLGGLDASTDSVAGALSTALEFNGSTDYIEIADNADLSGGTGVSKSWSFWFNIDANPASQNHILRKDLSSATKDWGFVYDAGNSVRFYHENGTNNDDHCAFASTFAPGTWYHISATFDGVNKTMRTYVDGTPDTLCVFTYDLADSTATVQIGKREYSGSELFDGRIDDVRIYTGVLTDAEVAALYAAGSP